jgi:hypothetical protein
MAISPERVQELDTKHGTVAHLKGADGTWEVVVRKPTRAEYKMFRGLASQPESRADAQEALLRRIIVEPEGLTAVDALFEAWPGIAESKTANAAIEQLTGMASQKQEK